MQVQGAMAISSDIDLSAGAEESVSFEEMVRELDQGGTVILDSSDPVANNLRQKLHEVRAKAFVENVEDGMSYFSISSTDSPDTERSPVTISANLERGTWEDLRGGGDLGWARGSSPFTLKQKILKKGLNFEVELRVEPFYRVEEEDMVVKLDLPTIMWRSNMEHNDKEKRGFFADVVVIQLAPRWQEDDRAPKNFFPTSSNDSAQMGSTKQASVGGTGSYINPMVTGTISRGTSQLVSVPNWIGCWAGGHDGIATFTWSLNLWCPISGGTSRALYKVEEFKAGDDKRRMCDWKNFSDVPELPSGYTDGNFNGFDTPRSVQWRVKGSTCRSKKLSWDVIIEVRTSSFWVRHGYIKMAAKVFKPFRSLKRESCYFIMSSPSISLASSTRNPLSHTIHEMNMWIIPLGLVVALVLWELGVRNFVL